MRIYDVFLLRMGTLDEKELSDNFEAMISYMGDTLAGDEKLFLRWYSIRSELVWTRKRSRS